nr:radical SAM family heme chaperone HemW [Halorhodospira abdelmalekii]
MPWCLRRCHYCDFNAYTHRGTLPVAAYVTALIRELERQALWLERARAERGERGRSPIESLFFGGGTPSLFPAAAIGRLITAVDQRLGLTADAEVTLEANPGAREHGRWRDYRAAGVNRLSLGVQSFAAAPLQRLGRIHDAPAAHASLREAFGAGFSAINIDLMYGLPGQGVAGAVEDVRIAAAYGVAHVSHYQLTIEPETPFGRSPPADLPDEGELEAIERHARAALHECGYERYEVSAFAQPQRRCRHNLNYWSYGDYLGLGAGAHGKVAVAPGRIERRVAVAEPRQWLTAAGRPQADAHVFALEGDEVAFELFANGLRLLDGIEPQQAVRHSGLAWPQLHARLASLVREGWLEQGADGRVRATPIGLRWLDSLLERLLP